MPPVENADPTAARTLVEVFRWRANHQGDRRALTFVHDNEAEDHLTYRELDDRARAVAARLQAADAEGERVLLLFPAGLEYVEAFLGCLYAGAIAVPVYPPHKNRTALRLVTVAVDSGARFGLATETILGRIQKRLEPSSPLASLTWLSMSGTAEGAGGWREPPLAEDSVAFLQYTSGSTGAPKGVILTHRHLLHNERMIQLAFDHTESRSVVGWLPLYHDMGLIGNLLQSLYSGAPLVLLSPETFLTKPLRWLQAIARHRAAVSGGPNSAYELCIAKISPEQRAQLDLSSWVVAYTGAEPIRPATIDRFCEAFAASGFRRESFAPCYGFAEATLLVAGGVSRRAPTVRAISAEGLSHGEAREARPDERARLLVGVGHPWLDERVVIVDPKTRHVLPPGKVGEIWVSGGSVGGGIWSREALTEEMFRAHLDSGEGPFLRSGDLGFIDENNELFFTCRLKDRIEFQGRDHYPQDIEEAVEAVHPAIRNGCVAAFAVERDGVAKVLVVAEVDRHFARKTKAHAADPEKEAARLAEIDALCAEIKKHLLAREGIAIDEVLLIGHNRIPRTTSGKIQRYACRAAYLSGELVGVRDETGDIQGTVDVSSE